MFSSLFQKPYNAIRFQVTAGEVDLFGTVSAGLTTIQTNAITKHSTSKTPQSCGNWGPLRGLHCSCAPECQSRSTSNPRHPGSRSGLHFPKACASSVLQHPPQPRLPCEFQPAAGLLSLALRLGAELFGAESPRVTRNLHEAWRKPEGGERRGQAGGHGGLWRPQLGLP